jgi:hypothetical protein
VLFHNWSKGNSSCVSLGKKKRERAGFFLSTVVTREIDRRVSEGSSLAPRRGLPALGQRVVVDGQTPKSSREAPAMFHRASHLIPCCKLTTSTPPRPLPLIRPGPAVAHIHLSWSGNSSAPANGPRGSGVCTHEEIFAIVCAPLTDFNTATSAVGENFIER